MIIDHRLRQICLGSIVACQLFIFAHPSASAELKGANQMMSVTYPATTRDDFVDDYFEQKIADPYRWLESDIRTDGHVAAWVAAQSKLTTDYLDTLPGRDIFKARLKQLSTYERFSIPLKKANRYFYQRTTGEQNQRILYVRDTADGPERMLIDPNSWSKDGATAPAEWSASDDGRLLAYAVQDGGTDWRTIHVMNVNTGKVNTEEIKWARFTSIVWSKDGAGFFYNRFPEPKQGAAPQAGVDNHAIYFHALGAPQAKDRLVYATPDKPILLHSFTLTSDGRYLGIISSPGSLVTDLTVVDLKSADGKTRKVAGRTGIQRSTTFRRKEQMFNQTDLPNLKQG